MNIQQLITDLQQNLISGRKRFIEGNSHYAASKRIHAINGITRQSHIIGVGNPDIGRKVATISIDQITELEMYGFTGSKRRTGCGFAMAKDQM